MSVKPDEAADVIVECELEASPERVWRALTVPELVTEWLLPNTLRAEVGSRFTFEADPAKEGTVECEVLEAEPHRRLSYTWRSAEADAWGRTLESQVTFELTDAGSGRTHLRVVHSGLPAGVGRRGTALQASGRSLAQLRPDARRRARPGRAKPTTAQRAHPVMLLRTAA